MISRSSPGDLPVISLASPALAGTIGDGRVFVAASTLGEHAGLGLFAGVAIRRNDIVTAYHGAPLQRAQVLPNLP